MTIAKRTGNNNKRVYTQEVVIASDASLSSAVEVGASKLVGILMPGTWTTAGITFAASVDGANFYSVNDAAGNEVAVTSPAANKFIVLSYVGIEGLFALKIRSGTVGSAVNQAGARTITLVFKDE